MGRRRHCWRLRYTRPFEYWTFVLERERVSRGQNAVGADPGSEFLKERLFGLSNPQGNHGESVKECHWHLDNVPTVSELFVEAKSNLDSIRIPNSNTNTPKTLFRTKISSKKMADDLG
jgi:hypothetical protein